MWGLFGWLAAGAWLWFCIVYFTGQHRLNWLEMILWVALISSVGHLMTFAFDEKSRALSFAGMLIDAGIRAGLLYLILTFRFKMDSISKKIKTIGLYLSIPLAVGIFIRAAR